MSQEQINYICPHCGTDLRECGIEERGFLILKFADGKFKLTDVEPTDELPVCKNCYEGITNEICDEIDLDYTIKPTSPAKTRYGNVIKENYYD